MTPDHQPISRFVRYALCSLTALLFVLPVALGVAVLLYDKNYHNPSHLSESNSIALGVWGLFSLTFSGVASGTFFSLLTPFLMFTVLNRFARFHPKGLRLTYAFMALGLGLMGYLAYDPVTQAQKEFVVPPLRKVATVAPKSLVWECSLDSEFSQIKNWKVPTAKYPEDFLNSHWIRGNAVQIEHDWQSSELLRQWFAKMDAHEGFDDFQTEVTGPILSYSAIRSGGRIICAKAILLASEGNHRDALKGLIHILSFSHKLKHGSRCLVTFAFGLYLESCALKSLEIIAADLPREVTLPISLLASSQKAEDLVCFRRAVLGDTQFKVQGHSLAQDQHESIPGRLLLFFTWNKNRTDTDVILRANHICELISRWDVEGLKSLPESIPESLFAEELYFKNTVGEILNQRNRPAGVGDSADLIQENAELRAKISSLLTRPN